MSNRGSRGLVSPLLGGDGVGLKPVKLEVRLM